MLIRIFVTVVAALMLAGPASAQTPQLTPYDAAVVASATVQSLTISGKNFRSGMTASTGVVASVINQYRFVWQATLNQPGQVRLTVRNRNGQASNAITITVVSPPAPQPLTLSGGPTDVSVEAPSAQGAVVTFPDAAPAGGVPPYTAVATTPLPSGAIFPVGTTAETQTVRDFAGNQATWRFSVGVTYTPPLVLTCPADYTVASPDGNAVALTYTALVSGGVPPYVGPTLTPADGSSFAVGGPWPVEATVSDAASPSQQASCSFTVTVTYAPPQPPPSGDGNAYFDAARANPKWFWGYSLRPRAGVTNKSDPFYANQLLGTSQGGFSGNSGYRGVTYDPAHDTDPHRQDAAKVVIPSFGDPASPGVPVSGTPQFTTVTAADGTVTHPAIPPTPLSADALDFYVPYGAINSAWYQRTVKIESELTGDIIVRDAATGHVALQPRDAKHPQGGRGSWGTTAVAHAAGARMWLSGNSVSNSPHIPVPKTEDGHSYLFVWDAYYTDSYVNTGLTNHKAFNFLSDGIWLEPDTMFSGGNDATRSPLWNRATDVAGFSVRNYNILGGKADCTLNDPTNAAGRNYAGPNVLNNDYTLPLLYRFVIKPNRWIRFFVLEEQSSCYDLVTIWIADRETGVVKTHDKLQLSLRKDAGFSIQQWVAEFNTSTDNFTGRNGSIHDLVAYIRNAFALKDLTAAEVSAQLQAPE